MADSFEFDRPALARMVNPLAGPAPLLVIVIMIWFLSFQLVLLSYHGFFNTIQRYTSLVGFAWLFELFILALILMAGLKAQGWSSGFFVLFMLPPVVALIYSRFAPNQ